MRCDGHDHVDQIDQARRILFRYRKTRIAAEKRGFQRVEQADQAQIGDTDALWIGSVTMPAKQPPSRLPREQLRRGGAAAPPTLRQAPAQRRTEREAGCHLMRGHRLHRHACATISPAAPRAIQVDADL